MQPRLNSSVRIVLSWMKCQGLCHRIIVYPLRHDQVWFDGTLWNFFLAHTRHDVCSSFLLKSTTPPPPPTDHNDLHLSFLSHPLPSSSVPPLPPSLLHPAFAEPLGVNDGGHMTKGAAPGHVCVSTALPDTMTRTHGTWRGMLTKDPSDFSV